MPKLIIPNAYELYKPEGSPVNQDEAIARQFYNARFLWLLEPGDIILLPELPAEGFLAYLASLKQIELKSFTVLTWGKELNSSVSEVLSDSSLIERLQTMISAPTSWSIQTCFFNQSVMKLAESLNIPIEPNWRRLVQQDFVRHMNSKANFRNLAESHDLPIPKGQVCLSSQSFIQAIQTLLKVTGQVIIKQEHNGGGRGNIGITIDSEKTFSGVIKTIVINDKQSIAEIAQQLWANYVDNLNQQLIVEVYYPKKGTFTTMLQLSPLDQPPVLLNYSEIRMESTWVGVQIPAHALLPHQVEKLVSASMKLAHVLQAYGYQGYLCCDAILSCDNIILFTEINVRPGAETHAHTLASHLFGKDYSKQTTILTRMGMKVSSFSRVYQMLKDQGLLLSPDNPSGVAILTVDDRYSNQIEYLVAAPDLTSAYTLENQLMLLLQGCSERIEYI